MAKPLFRTLPAEEHLYRLLRPSQWSDKEGYVAAAAFRDDHKPDDRGLSMQVASMCLPSAVLVKFALIPAIRREYGNPRPEDLVDHHGFGMARVRVALVAKLGLDFVRDETGMIKVGRDGHVQVWDGRTRAAFFAYSAIILSRDEIFGAPSPRA